MKDTPCTVCVCALFYTRCTVCVCVFYFIRVRVRAAPIPMATEVLFTLSDADALVRSRQPRSTFRIRRAVYSTSRYAGSDSSMSRSLAVLQTMVMRRGLGWLYYYRLRV